MGMETIALKVGAIDDVSGSMIFTIHKNLLVASSRRFASMLEECTPLEKGEIYVIHDTSPFVFKLFNEYLYTRRIPGISRRLSAPEQGIRVSELCQLYVFAEIFEMDNTFLNKVMDTIQDGLIVSDMVITHTLVVNIFEHAKPDSPLRKFCIATALHSAVSPGLDTAGFKWLLKNSDAFFDEFLAALKKLPKGNDPRIRDVGQEYTKDTKEIKEEELEAGGVSVDKADVESTGVTGPGVHPCQFHIHHRAVSGSDAGTAHADGEDEVCYLRAEYSF